jgi:hypothetical protein
VFGIVGGASRSALGQRSGEIRAVAVDRSRNVVGRLEAVIEEPLARDDVVETRDGDVELD